MRAFPARVLLQLLLPLAAVQQAMAVPWKTAPVVLFQPDAAYHNYRIPSLVTTQNGSVLAFAEGRPAAASQDSGDIVFRRSTDGGLTWSSQVTLQQQAGYSFSNATTVLDQSNGRVWLLYNRWDESLGGGGLSFDHPSKANTAWARYSDDNGVTWSTPNNITSAVKDAGWNSTAFAPGSGIQASNGTLVIPAALWMSGFRTYAVYSTNNGATWQRGAVSPSGNVSGENQIVQLETGELFREARTNQAGNPVPRLWSKSSDLGLTWTTETNGHAGLAYGAVAPSLQRFTSVSAGDTGNRILWTGPAQVDAIGARELRVLTSYNEGVSFGNDKVLYTGYANYSDMAVLKDRTVGVLIETDFNGDAARSLSYLRFNQTFIEPPSSYDPRLIASYYAPAAGANIEPDEITHDAWTRTGQPMQNNGLRLLQDNTGNGSQQDYGYYTAPTVPPGTMKHGQAAPYGIEFRVRPLTDIAFTTTDWANLFLTWSDDQYNYNITVDQFSGANSSGTGSIVYGRGSLSPAITGIDWSVPHTIFIGHRGQGGASVFDFYLDGVLKSTITDGSIARSLAGYEYLRDRIEFGDGTTGGNDARAEWYSVYAYTVNTPTGQIVPEPAGAALALTSFFGVWGRRGAKRKLQY